MCVFGTVRVGNRKRARERESHSCHKCVGGRECERETVCVCVSVCAFASHIFGTTISYRITHETQRLVCVCVCVCVCVRERDRQGIAFMSRTLGSSN